MKKDFEVIDDRLEAGKGAIRSYIAGFVISLVLTLLPYFMVTRKMFEADILIYSIMVFGVAQLLVQVIFFLHLSKKTRSHWNLIVFAFTFVIILFLVAGSLWIMHNLNRNMTVMPQVNSKQDDVQQ